MKNYKIAVAGTGYVGLSLGVLLSQHHQVVAVDIVQAKVDMINNKKSPIQDEYIEKYLKEKELNLTATLDAEAAYKDADFVVIAARRQMFKQDLISVLVNTYKNLDAYVIAEIVDVAYHDFLYNGFDLILNSAVAMCKIYDALNLKYKCTPKLSK